jgi:hypothetical protein
VAYKKKDFITAFELLLNTLQGDKIEIFFGEGTKIKIRDVIFSSVKKVCLVDCIVIFGKDILPVGQDEENFVRSMIYSTSTLMISEYSVNVMIGYDI